MAQQLRGGAAPVDVNLETLVEEVLEDGRQLVALLDVRLAIGRDQVEGLKPEYNLIEGLKPECNCIQGLKPEYNCIEGLYPEYN